MAATNSDEWVWVPFQVDKMYDGLRVDQYLSKRLIGYSREKVQGLLKECRVLRDEKTIRPSARVRTAEIITVGYLRRPESPLSEELNLPILYEDVDLIIVNKPANLLSHPTDKIQKRTVLGCLRHFRPDITSLHLLHRLDRETSGALALGKNAPTATRWTRAMERREIHKRYLALVWGKPPAQKGVINAPMGKEFGPIKVRQSIHAADAVEAVTEYEVLETKVFPNSRRAVTRMNEARGETDAEFQRRWKTSTERLISKRPQIPESKHGVSQPFAPAAPADSVFSVVRAFPKTGRLHQIRVHFASIGCPLLGDTLYIGNGEAYQKRILGEWSEDDQASLGFERCALHAEALEFNHPRSGKPMTVTAPLPQDLRGVIDWRD